MTREDAQGFIDREFARVREANVVGNTGKARVCARRASGIAITYWLQRHETKGWGDDNMSQLRAVADDPDIPEEVRSSAVRLTTKITEAFTSPFSSDPIADGTTLVDYFLSGR